MFVSFFYSFCIFVDSLSVCVCVSVAYLFSSSSLNILYKAIFSSSSGNSYICFFTVSHWINFAPLIELCFLFLICLSLFWGLVWLVFAGIWTFEEIATWLRTVLALYREDLHCQPGSRFGRPQPFWGYIFGCLGYVISLLDRFASFLSLNFFLRFYSFAPSGVCVWYYRFSDVAISH